MRTTIDVKNKLKLISQMGEESKFQILKYDSLNGTSNLKGTLAIKSIEDSGQRVKQIRILLTNSGVKLQDNVLSYMKGYIERSDIVHKYKGIKKILFEGRHFIDSNIKTLFRGSGEILLKPSFSDFTLIELVDEEIIINDDIFYACDEEINISLISNNYKEIKLSGSGVVVLKLPVIESEIIRCKLFNDRLVVNDNLVILKSNNINMHLEKYERLLEEDTIEESNTVYNGIGEVWILPTRSIYDKYGKIDFDIYEEYENTDEKI